VKTGEFDLFHSAGNPQPAALLLYPATVGTRFGTQLMIDMATGDFTAVET